jgi:chromosome segregation ATPase
MPNGTMSVSPKSHADILFEVLADPEHHKKKLKEFTDAQSEADKRMSAANEKEAKNRETEAHLRAREEAIQQREKECQIRERSLERDHARHQERVEQLRAVMPQLRKLVE